MTQFQARPVALNEPTLLPANSFTSTETLTEIIVANPVRTRTPKFGHPFRSTPLIRPIFPHRPGSARGHTRSKRASLRTAAVDHQHLTEKGASRRWALPRLYAMPQEQGAKIPASRSSSLQEAGLGPHDLLYASSTSPGSPSMAIRPASSQTTRSQSRRTSSIACDTITSVTPCRRKSASRS